MTARRPRVLLVTTKFDVTADYVVLALERRAANFYRLNTEDFPEAATSSFEVDKEVAWQWTNGNDGIDLSDVRAVWFRRHRLPRLKADLEGGQRDFCLRECDWFFRGALLSRTVHWMSLPSAVAVAEAKLFQLQTAHDLGLTLPRTLVTNDIVRARRFVDQHEQVIAKPVRVGYIDQGDGGLGIFSNLITAHDLAGEGENLRLAPVIFQEFVEKSCDIRVTVVGERLFAARIDSQAVPSARIDWRRSETDALPHSSIELPPDLSRRCLDLVRRLGLVFGAIDLVVDKLGRHYFLEINPNGQWAWIQDKLGIDIAGTIADWLVSAERTSFRE